MLKLNAGVSRKVGLPGFSSASASCTIEAELDSTLLQDHEGLPRLPPNVASYAGLTGDAGRR